MLRLSTVLKYRRESRVGGRIGIPTWLFLSIVERWSSYPPQMCDKDNYKSNPHTFHLLNTNIMKKLLFLLAILTTICFTSCTENSRARTFGGKQTITLQPNERLINMTWKDHDLWLLTQDTLTGVQYFRENSSWGLLEGQITIEMESIGGVNYY